MSAQTRDYAKAFRVVRAAMDLGQRQLGELIGVTESHISLIESGRRNPSLKLLDSLGSATGIHPPLMQLLACGSEDVKAMSGPEFAALAEVCMRKLVAA